MKEVGNTKVLILGGEGYIGSAVFARISETYETAKYDIEQYQETYFPSFDVVINLAAHSSVALCQMFPESAIFNNLKRIERIIDNLTSNQFLIHASSASVYGIGNFESNENDNLQLPNNLYDETKMETDKLVTASLKTGKRVASLRFGTVSGLSLNTRVDLVLNAMVLSARERGEISVINPGIRRNILLIDDLVEALIRLIKKNAYGIYNLGSLNATIGTLANTISAKYPAKINIVESKDLSPFDFHLNTDKLERVIGNYRVTNLENTIDKLWEGLNESKHSRANVHGPHPMLGMRLE
jgi:nucleoside-diphosphate-sugar epimerase